MSLPWFPFNIKDFLANTKRLNTEAKGAYLCLMLDYYEHEAGAPDDDDILASICELPLEAWKRHRKVIAPLFEIKDGFWHHDRIESEMLEAKTKHTSSITRAKAGAAARWAEKPSSIAQAVPPAPRKHRSSIKNASSTAPSIAQAVPEQCLDDAHLTLTLKNSLSTDRDAILEGTGPVDTSEAVGTPIDPTFWPDPNHITVCKIDGATDEIVQAEVAAFIANKRESGAFSNDWDASWSMWWKRWKEHQAKLAKTAKPRAAPRVEVSGRPEPTEKDWDSTAKIYAATGRWSIQFGPEPTSPACRCPPEILARHKIKPATAVTAWRPAPAKEPV